MEKVNYSEQKVEDLVKNYSWMIRPCALYKEEYSDCTSLQSRLHQQFVSGSFADCSQWTVDYSNCKKWTDDGDAKALVNEDKFLVCHDSGEVAGTSDTLGLGAVNQQATPPVESGLGSKYPDDIVGPMKDGLDDHSTTMSIELPQKNGYSSVSLLESETNRRHERIGPHFANDVWKRRETPPEDWNGPLPEWLDQKIKSSYLSVKSEEAKQGKQDGGRCVIS